MICLQINEALNDTPQDNVLDFSMRNEVEQILSVGKRIAACMARCDPANTEEVCFRSVHSQY